MPKCIADKNVIICENGIHWIKLLNGELQYNGDCPATYWINTEAILANKLKEKNEN